MALAPIELAQIAAGNGGFAINGAAAGDTAGFDVASAGDINGDGFDDILIGAPLADPAAESNAGRAYVVFGRAQPFAAAVELSAVAAGTGGFALSGRAAGDVAGWAVASAGDVNADGFADLLIGAFDADPSAATGAGESYVVFGAASGLGGGVNLATVAAGTGGFAISGAAAGDRSGHAVAGAGDIDGDGFDDVLVGAYRAASAAGRAYLVFGSTSPATIALATPAQRTAFNGQAKSDQAGFAVAGIGDINGDGRADFVLGARSADTPAGKDSGRSYVVFGAAQRPAAIDLAQIAAGTGGFAINGQSAADRAGHTVAAAGDINGDGLADLIIAAPFATVGLQANAGQTYVVFGRTSGFGATLDLAAIAAGKGGFVLTGEAADDLSGVSAATAGDLNGDGFDDLIVGAHLHDPATRPDGGRSYVLLGRAGGFGASITLASLAAGTNGFAINGQAKDDLSGFAVSAAGDVDGDGFADLLVGAYAANSAAGRLYVILGRDFAGTVSHPGSTAAETLTGSAAPDTMVGGQGSDVLLGNGGADVLLGGAGDDTLRVSDLGFRRVDGGGGTDTLALDGKAMVLDLTAASQSRLRGIERISLAGSGDNRLLLSGPAVTALSTAGNALRVDGDAGDTLVLRDAGWTKGGSAGGYTTYTRGAATLDAADALAVSASGPLSIQRQDAFRTEGTGMPLGGTTAFTFNVTRAGNTLGTASAAWAVTGGTLGGTLAATAADFAAGVLPSGTVHFTDGQTSAGITVAVLADAQGELNESFTVTLSDIAGNAQPGTAAAIAAATGVILNDDTTFSIIRANASRAEGTGGTTPFTFIVTRAGGNAASHNVQWAAAGIAGPGTLPANAADFTGGTLPSGTVTFAAFETQKTLTLAIAADTAGEFNERFAVALSNPSPGSTLAIATAGAIVFNDDTSLALATARIDRAEGNAGSTLYTYTVNRSGNLAPATTVDWTLTPGGMGGTVAVTAADFLGNTMPTGGTLAFAPQQRSATITLAIAGDTIPELNESFSLSLANATPGVAIAAPTGYGVVLDDDVIYGTAGPDILVGTAGNDLFVIGQGNDSITGDAGRDSFRFLPSALGPAASNSFTLEDFNRALGEKLDLSRIDAVAGGLDNPFTFIGTAAFNGSAGQLRWEDKGTFRLIQATVNADTVADLTISAKAAGPVDAGWFVL